MNARRFASTAPVLWLGLSIQINLSAQYNINTLIRTTTTTNYDGGGVAADNFGNVYLTSTVNSHAGTFVMDVNSMGAVTSGTVAAACTRGVDCPLAGCFWAISAGCL